MTKGNMVVDTGILDLFFAGDARVRAFFEEIERKRNGYVTGVNLSEFFYKTCQILGEDVAKLRYQQCRELLQILETNREYSLEAGKEKCHRGGNLSLADCFALAAAKNLHGMLLTTDPMLAEIKDIEVRFFEVS
jgi:predicted nucleic acid-binding protein